MIRPETLLHSNQAIDADFRASVRLKAKTLHCGLGMNGYYWEPEYIQKFATQRVFVAVLAALGFIQGAAMGYFSATANMVAQNFGFSKTLIDWALVSNEIAQGVFGLVFSYWGSRGHRPEWIAGCCTLQALFCFLLMLPQLVHNTDSQSYINITATEQEGELLCHARNATSTLDSAGDTCYFTMFLMFLVQLGAGLGGIALLSHGVAYVDDNVAKRSSPALIGEIIALRHLGPQMGVLLAWRCMAIYAGPLQQVPSSTSSQWVGAWWIGWPVLSSLMFVVVILLAMFPKQLPSQAVKEMAASIVDLARGVTIQEPVDPKLNNTGFFWSIRRLFTNKIIIFNTLATVCLQTAMANYLALEDKYLESKYNIPRPQHGAQGFLDPWTSRLIISLLKPPLVALHILVSGLVISRTRMQAGRITAWHAVIALSVAIFMISRIFTNCPSLHIQGEENGRFQLLQVCNRECNCPASTRFEPVCSQEGSILYYSPCHAGCKEFQYLDDVRLYAKCECVIEKVNNVSIHRAKGGPCNNPGCNFSWVLNQCFTVLTAALVGTRLVGNAVITFRSVQPQDKSLAVGLELTLVGLISYIPGNLLYQLMAETSCLYRGSRDQEDCKLYNAGKFGLYLNLVTACLLLICAALSLAVWYYARDLDLYKDEDEDDDDIYLHRKRDPKISSRQATPSPKRRKKNMQGELGSVQDELDPMSRQQAADEDLRFELMEMSDHMEDSMEANSPVRQRQPSIF